MTQIESPYASGGRGFVTGQMFNRKGEVVIWFSHVRISLSCTHWSLETVSCFYAAYCVIDPRVSNSKAYSAKPKSESKALNAISELIIDWGRWLLLFVSCTLSARCSPSQRWLFYENKFSRADKHPFGCLFFCTQDWK